MQCNALQAIIGIFLQSCNTPETVREFLAHVGLSVLPSSINKAISSLSKESENQIRKTGRTLMASYAYDNLDIDLKHLVNDTVTETRAGFCDGYGRVRVRVPIFVPLPNPYPCDGFAGNTAGKNNITNNHLAQQQTKTW